MFNITRSARSILKSTKKIKDFTLSSMTAMTKYLKPSQDKGYIEEESQEFVFKKELSEFIDVKAQNSCSDFDVIKKEYPIDWAVVRKLIYERFADEISGQVVEPTKAVAVRGISEEFKDLRAQGYDFKKVSNLIEKKKGVIVNEYELEGRSNISNVSDSSLIERMKKLSIAGYLSNYLGADGLRQSVEEVIIKKEACMDEIKSMFSINKGLLDDNYDGSESVTLVGIEAM